jgi:hypothetical protein
VKTMLMVFFGALILGFAFAGSSYFVTKEQDVLFECYFDSRLSINQVPTYNKYTTTNNGFPFAFYTKYSQPVSSGCQKPEYSDKNLAYNSDGTLAPFAQLNKVNLAKDVATWSVVFLVLGGLVFGVGAKKKS